MNTKINRGRWSDFVNSHPKGNIFQTPEMYEVYDKTLNHEPFLIAIEDNNVVLGIMLLVIQKEYSGILGPLTTRCIIRGGPLVDNESTDILNRILEELKRLVSTKTIYSEIRNFWNWPEEHQLIFSNHGFKFIDHLDIIHDLSLSPGELFQKFHKGRRKNINRAERGGLIFRELRESEELDIAYQMVKQTYSRIKVPLPDPSLFFKTYEVLQKKPNIMIFFVEAENVIIGTRIVLCFKETIYDWYAGSHSDFLDRYPNDYLPWKVMEWGIDNGYKYFDFGGAGKPGVPYGVRDFKLKFGGELVNLGRYEKIHRSFLMFVGRMGYELKKRL